MPIDLGFLCRMINDPFQLVGTVTIGALVFSPVSVRDISIIKNENTRLEARSVSSIQKKLPRYWIVTKA